jgi:hypothetical protein
MKTVIPSFAYIWVLTQRIQVVSAFASAYRGVSFETRLSFLHH